MYTTCTYVTLVRKVHVVFPPENLTNRVKEWSFLEENRVLYPVHLYAFYHTCSISTTKAVFCDFLASPSQRLRIFQPSDLVSLWAMEESRSITYVQTINMQF